jgi:hypothetical protein
MCVTIRLLLKSIMYNYLSVPVQDWILKLYTSAGATRRIVRLFILCSCAINFPAFSQGSHSVDLVTGTMNVSLPLFTVTEGNISIDGNLFYGGNGVKITDDEGWVGQNWSVTPQFFKISREMRGLPDDFLGVGSDVRKGWLHGDMGTRIKNFVPNTDNNTATCSDESPNYIFLQSFQRTQDTEPDVFHVNAPGMAFQFYFDEAYVPRAVPQQDIEIIPTFDPVTKLITSVLVRDDKGIEYKFADTETLTQSLLATNDYFFFTRSRMHLNPMQFNITWRLTEIKSPVYGTINFEYKTLNLANNDLVPDWYKKTDRYKYRYALSAGNGNGALSTLNYSRTYVQKNLTRIYSNSTEVQFLALQKAVGSPIERLKTIKIYDKREGISKLVSEFNLVQTPDANDRLFLTEVQAKAGTSVLKHILEYYGGAQPYNHWEKDRWEFYKVNGVPYDETVQSGSLKKITYPLKGYTAFFYEPHDYVDEGTLVSGAGLRIKKIISSFGGTTEADDAVEEFEYKKSDGTSSGKVNHKALNTVSVARINYFSSNGVTANAPRYADLQQLLPAVPTSTINEYFTLSASQELSKSELLNNSFVGYTMVTAKRKDGGKRVYEFDLPITFGSLSANNNEWQASKILIARPAAPSPSCFQIPNIAEGYNCYPFPPQSKL